MRPAVFLDRDGTMIEDVGYLNDLSRIALYPWTVDVIRMLNRAGFAVVVVTNQSGIARGILTEALVTETHRRIDARLAAGGAHVDGYYHCPHYPHRGGDGYAARCECRKPGRGMVDKAAADLALDPASSFVIGDRWIDVQLGRAVGARAVLVRTGSGAAEELQAPPGVEADAVVDNLAAAASWLLRAHLHSATSI